MAERRAAKNRDRLALVVMFAGIGLALAGAFMN